MSDSNLSINTTHHNNVDVVSISGRVDSSNYTILDKALKASLTNGQHHLVLNMSEVEYLSSAGLRAMVSALRECKKKSGDVRVAAPSDRVREVLDLSGLDLMFTSYPDNEHAMGSF